MLSQMKRVRSYRDISEAGAGQSRPLGGHASCRRAADSGAPPTPLQPRVAHPIRQLASPLGVSIHPAAHRRPKPTNSSAGACQGKRTHVSHVPHALHCAHTVQAVPHAMHACSRRVPHTTPHKHAPASLPPPAASGSCGRCPPSRAGTCCSQQAAPPQGRPGSSCRRHCCLAPRCCGQPLRTHVRTKMCGFDAATCTYTRMHS